MEGKGPSVLHEIPHPVFSNSGLIAPLNFRDNHLLFTDSQADYIVVQDKVQDLMYGCRFTYGYFTGES